MGDCNLCELKKMGDLLKKELLLFYRTSEGVPSGGLMGSDGKFE